MVWADPRSLAATEGVDVSFSSWGYLDVSVVPVPSCNLCIQLQVFRYNPEGVSAFGNLRIVTCLAIPRSLSQPCYLELEECLWGVMRRQVLARCYLYFLYYLANLEVLLLVLLVL